MKPNYEMTIEHLHQTIDCLIKEIRLKDKLIRNQDTIIKTLEEHNAELTELLDSIFNSQ